MAMKFISIGAAIVTLLENNVGVPAQFRVQGFQAQKKAAELFVDTDRLVEVSITQEQPLPFVLLGIDSEIEY